MFLCDSYMRLLIVKAEPGVSELRLCTALGRRQVDGAVWVGVRITVYTRCAAVLFKVTGHRNKRRETTERRKSPKIAP